MANILGLAHDKVRVIAPYVGAREVVTWHAIEDLTIRQGRTISGAEPSRTARAKAGPPRGL